VNQCEKELKEFLGGQDRETRSLFRQMRGVAARTIFDTDWFAGGQLNTRLYCEPKLVLKALNGDFGDMDEDDLRDRFSDYRVLLLTVLLPVRQYPVQDEAWVLLCMRQRLLVMTT